MEPKPKLGLAVDGYCKGNPGIGGYKGVDIETGEVIFKCELQNCTNNIAEFIGLVHAVMHCKKAERSGIGKKFSVVYSDSTTAIAWLKKKACNSSLENPDDESKKRIRKCEIWLSEQQNLVDVKKWITSEWGEIPADYGHKN